MATIRPPGVFVEREADPRGGLSLGRTGVPGFLGVASRGPVDSPTRLTSFDIFRSIFGERVPGAYLYDAIKGFFDNGGEECFVVRIVRTEKRKGLETAALADAVFKDQLGKDTLAVAALNEGAWGNELDVRMETPEEPRAQTFLMEDMQKGESTALVKSTRGFLRGTITKITDGEHDDYLTVVSVEGKRIRFDKQSSRKFQASSPTYLEPVEFTITATRRRRTEVFEALSFAPSSARFFERYVNQSSRLIQVVSLDSPSGVPDCYPKTTEPVRLSGGADGIRNLSPEDFIGYNKGPHDRKGVAALEVEDEVDLVLAPDLMFAYEKSDRFRSARDVEAVQDAIITHCERLKDRFAILDLLPDAGYEQAQQWRLLFDSSYAAFYFPWIVVESGSGTRAIPPSGHVVGVAAHCDETQGVHRAPANVMMKGVVDLAVELNDRHLAELNKAGINTIRALPNRGIRIWGARTICSDPQWRYLNVRRLFTMLVRTLRNGTQWAVFEPNNAETWRAISLDVQVFLDKLFANGYFKGSAPSEAFYVKCDGEINPPEVIDAGQLIIDIGVAPARPAEFITVRVHHHTEGEDLEGAEE